MKNFIIINGLGTKTSASEQVCVDAKHAHAIKLIENVHASKSHPINKHWIDYVNQMWKSFQMTRFFPTHKYAWNLFLNEQKHKSFFSMIFGCTTFKAFFVRIFFAWSQFKLTQAINWSVCLQSSLLPSSSLCFFGLCCDERLTYWVIQI